MKKGCSVLLIVLVAIVLLATIAPVPANAWYAECEQAATWGWHSWGQNVSCVQAILADIIGTGGE